MKCINEVFVPTGWNVTTEETAQNLFRPSWPLVTTTEENIFDLSVLVSTKNDEEPDNEKHQLVLNFIYGNIVFYQMEILLNLKKKMKW